MPKADYHCNECGRTFEHEAPELPQTIERTHDFHPNMKALCNNKSLTRVWGPVNIGRVEGAGGSPSR